MDIKRGGIRAGIEVPQIFLKHLGVGAVATDGIQYSGVVTFGTTATEVINELVDPGFSMRLVGDLEVGFTQKFEGLNASFVGTIMYYWQARTEYLDLLGSGGVLAPVTGSWIPLLGTLSKATGTLTTSEDTLSGYIPVGSITHAPVRFRLMAQSLVPNSTGKVKNSSRIKMVGNILPGS